MRLHITPLSMPCVVYYHLLHSYISSVIYKFDYILDDQTQEDSKPAGQPQHVSLNHCQLKAANRPKLMLWAPPAGGGDKVFQ